MAQNPHTFRVNYLAVAAAFLITQLGPMGWYAIMGEPWMQYSGITEEMAAKGDSTPFIFSTVTGILQLFALVVIFGRMGIRNAFEGLATASLVTLAFTSMEFFTYNSFEFRPWQLSFIDGGGAIVTNTIVGAILGGWQKRG